MLDRHTLKARLFLTGLIALLFVVLAGVTPAAADDDDDDGDYGRYYHEEHHYYGHGHGHWGHKHRHRKHWRRHHRHHHHKHKHRRRKVVEHHHYHYDSPPPSYRTDYAYPAPRYNSAGSYGRCNGYDGALAGGIFGGGAGAAIGAAAGDGDPAAVVGGILAGVLVGSALGHSIDAQDSYCIGQTLEHAPDGSTITWDNPVRQTSYEVTPKASYRREDGRYCREFISTATVAGREQQVYGTACWQPDGSWQIVQANQ